MRLLRPDHETRYEVPGVPGRVRKPVNLDGAAVGFTRLRSLRSYRFEAGSVIDGHAEEDEVFVIVTSGSVTLQIGFHDDAVDGFGTFQLSAPGSGSTDGACVAYLPPHSVYRMTPRTDADVFYARATPTEVREPAVFRTDAANSSQPANTVFQDRTHAERLRLRILRIVPAGSALVAQPLDPADEACEAFLHVQGEPAAKVASISRGVVTPLDLASWDTVALSPGEAPLLHVEQGSAALVVAVMAC